MVALFSPYKKHYALVYHNYDTSQNSEIKLEIKINWIEIKRQKTVITKLNLNFVSLKFL